MDGTTSTFVNDWLVHGENTIGLEPIGASAEVDLRIGGHATFAPSPKKTRHNRVHYEGTLKHPKTWTFVAEAARPEPTSWPTEPMRHLADGLQRWLAGEDERSLEPWAAWLDSEVRTKLTDAGAVSLEAVMMEIELTVGDAVHLGGYFVPSKQPGWVVARFEARAGRGEYNVDKGPRRVWSGLAEGLVADLRDKSCAAAQRRVPAASIIEALPSARFRDALPKTEQSTDEALRRACRAIKEIADDAPVTYLLDDVMLVARNQDGRPVAIVSSEISFRAKHFLVAVLKPPEILER